MNPGQPPGRIAMRPTLARAAMALVIAGLMLPFPLPKVDQDSNSALLGDLSSSILDPLATHAQDCAPLINIDAPTPNATVRGPTTFTGWAVDRRAATGSGVSNVSIGLDTLPSQGGTLLGSASQTPRPDVVTVLGVSAVFGFSATFDLSAVPPGPHTFYVVATTACGSSNATVL